MTRRELFTAFLAALGLVVGVKTGGARPLGAAEPQQIWRNRYNDPPDQTLHQQIFS